LKVTLKAYTNLRRVIGKMHLVVEMGDDSTLEDLLTLLSEKYGEEFERENKRPLKDSFRRDFNVYLKGNLVHPSDYPRAKLRDQDEVAIVPPVGGG
jgi:MoaD family protein